MTEMADTATPTPAQATPGRNGSAPAPQREGDRATDGGTRTRRLLEGLAALSNKRGGGLDGERLLFLLGAVAVPLGILFLVLGWYGTAGSGLVFEQLPYVVSGGLGGLALVILGCTLYACWWLTRSIREERERHERLTGQNDELLRAVRDLSDEVAGLRRELGGR